jgi:uncharacterized protein (TIGR01244 family)
MLNEQKINKQITIGGRPDAEELAKLKERGFKTIINLLTSDEPGFAEEELLVENLGLTYSSVPVSPALLDDLAVSRFSQAIVSSDGPVAVHCKSGGRAGLMTLMHLGVSHGWTVEHTIEEGEKLGIKLAPDSPYRDFFADYIKRHSAGER